jgi:alkylation response protein AidB-like acyl-CoA dehydrogenase
MNCNVLDHPFNQTLKQFINTTVIDTFGTEELRQKYLPKMTAFDIMASYCLTEPGTIS